MNHLSIPMKECMPNSQRSPRRGKDFDTVYHSTINVLDSQNKIVIQDQQQNGGSDLKIKDSQIIKVRMIENKKDTQPLEMPSFQSLNEQSISVNQVPTNDSSSKGTTMSVQRTSKNKKYCGASLKSYIDEYHFLEVNSQSSK